MRHADSSVSQEAAECRGGLRGFASRLMLIIIADIFDNGKACDEALDFLD